MPSRLRPILLASALAAVPAGLQGSDAPIRISGTGAALGLMERLGEAYSGTGAGRRVQVLPSIGSSGGIRAAAEGRIDLAVSSRPLQAEEATGSLQQRPFARTPFVFAVRAANPLAATSLDDALGCYEGRIRNSPDGGRLRLVLRPRSDSAHAYLAGLSPRFAKALDAALAAPGAIVAMTDQDGATMLEKTPGAFGTTTLGQLRTEHPAVKALALDGVAPTLENLERGRYPLATTIQLVYRDPSSPQLQEFLRFLRTARAAAILRRNGFLPQAEAGP